MLQHWIWYAELGKLSCAQKQMLLQHFHDPEELYYCSDKALEQVPGVTAAMVDALSRKSLTQAQTIIEECANKGIGILTIQDKRYPVRLKNTCDPPMVLYYRGTLPDWDITPAIGVVGTRKASTSGLRTAYRFGGQIATCGGMVISGGAAGIDTMALEGAMAAGQPVVAVFGCGIDVVYPKKNKALFERIAENGCLLSEYPPRVEAFGWHFPERNRIISGLSSGTLVVEAPEGSGALITARHALEQGRDVYVVPGNVDEPACAGSNALLRDGGIPVLSGWDILREYQAVFPERIERRQFSVQAPAEPAEQKAAPRRTPDKKSIDKEEKSTYSVVNHQTAPISDQEQAVFKEIGREPMTVDDVIQRTGLPAGKVKAVLTKLTVKGILQNHPGGRISRKS